MAKKGLIKKSKDLERKNMVRVTLTEKGKEAYEVTTKRGPIHRILGILNKDERREFHGYLERVLAKSREELGMDRDELPSSD
jgi:MarR family 2-MHQ and catechol resistance regulon transcriptional repressor